MSTPKPLDPAACTELVTSDEWRLRFVPWPNGCWRWKKRRYADCYGSVRLAGRTVRAHRVAWIAANGYDPGDLVIDHLCRVKDCVNPSHLEAVPQAINASRAALRLKVVAA